jgi:hypothetical protein
MLSKVREAYLTEGKTDAPQVLCVLFTADSHRRQFLSLLYAPNQIAHVDLAAH